MTTQALETKTDIFEFTLILKLMETKFYLDVLIKSEKFFNHRT